MHIFALVYLTRSFFFLSGVMKPFLAFLPAAWASSPARTSAFFRSISDILLQKKDLCCEANNHFFKSIDKLYQSLYWTRAQAHNQMFIHLLVLSHTGGKTWTKGASSLPPGWCSPLTLLSASSPALRQDWPGGSGWKIAQAGSAKWPRGSAA